MNSFLISVGFAIVLALSAALVGPVFIDWNGYRATIEDAGARLTGRTVEISGTLDVTILPAPVLRAKKVILFNPDDGREAPLATAREVVLKLDLSALLLGRIEITDLEVVGARLRLLAGPDGTVNWGGVGGARSGDISDAALRRVVLSGASVVFADAATAVERRITGLDAEITAATLAGPFRLIGSFGDSDNRRKITLSTGAVRTAGPLLVSGQVDVPFGARLSFDGTLTGWDKPPRYNGRVRLVKPLASAAPNNGDPGRLVVEAQVDAGTRDAQITELTLATSGAGQPVNLAGSARLDWRGDPAFNIELKALRLDIDTFLAASGTDQPVAKSLGAVAGLADKWLRDTGAGGQLALQVGGVVLSGELIQNLDVTIDVTDGEIGINAQKMRFPGQTDLSINGTMQRAQGPYSFTGAVFLNALDFNRFVNWAAPERYSGFLAVLPATRGKLSLRGDLVAGDGQFTLSGIDALLDGQAVSGAVAVTPGSPGAVKAELSFDNFDLDRKLSAGAGGLATLGANGAPVPVFKLGLRAKRLRWRGQEALNARLDATLEQGRWQVVRVAVDNFAGAAISASGSVAMDYLSAGAGAMADVRLTLKTAALPALLKVLPQGPPLLDWLGAGRTRQMRAANVEFKLGVEKIEAGWRLDGGLNGVVGGTTIALKGSGEIGAGDVVASALKGTLALANPEAGRLLGQLGLPAAVSGDTTGAVLSVALQSGGPAPLRLTGSARVRETEFTISAAIEPERLSYAGKATVRARSSTGFAGLLALAAPVAAQKLALDVEFSGDGDGVSVVNLTGQVAGAKITAAGDLVFADRPQVSVAVGVDTVSLPWLARSMFIGPSASPPAANPGQDGQTGGGDENDPENTVLWSTELLNTEIFDLADIEINAAVGRLAVSDRYWLYKTDALLNLEKGGLRLADFSARSGPGEDAGAVRAELRLNAEDFSLGLRGELSVIDADIARLLTDTSARPLAQGRLGLQAQFSAGGRSLLSLVSTLRGKGEFTVTQASLPRLDWAGLRDASGKAAGAATGGESELMSLLFEKAMSGQTPLALESGTLEAANGRIQFGPLIASGAGSRGEVTTLVDLPAFRLDQELALEASDSARLTVVHAGKFAEISRQIEVTNITGEPIRFVEPPADQGQAQMRKNLPGALPARPKLARLRQPSSPVPAPKPMTGAPEFAVPAISLVRPQPTEPVAPKSTPSAASEPPVAAIKPESDVDKKKQLPAGLIEQRLIDLPLPPA